MLLVVAPARRPGFSAECSTAGTARRTSAMVCWYDLRQEVAGAGRLDGDFVAVGFADDLADGRSDRESVDYEPTVKRVVS